MLLHNKSLPVIVLFVLALGAVFIPAAHAGSADCGTILQKLLQAHDEAVKAGNVKASARQLEQSKTYLRRLKAWWEMDPQHPMIQATCAAFTKGYNSSDGSVAPEDQAAYDAHGGSVEMSDEDFNMLMKIFDEAGVPR